MFIDRTLNVSESVKMKPLRLKQENDGSFLLSRRAGSYNQIVNGDYNQIVPTNALLLTLRL